MSETVIHFEAEREKRLKELQQAISSHVQRFLDHYDTPRTVDIVWSDDSSLTELGFTLIKPDTGDTILTGERLHQALIRYFTNVDIEELQNYERNIYSEPHIISFIKIT